MDAHPDPLGALLAQIAEPEEQHTAREAREDKKREARAPRVYKKTIFDFVFTEKFVGVHIKMHGHPATKDSFPCNTTLTEIHDKYPGAVVHVGTQRILTNIQDAIDAMRARKPKTKARPSIKTLLLRRNTNKPARIAPHASKHYGF
jgi:hypothetical protein